jgi:hypothetical protein
LVASRLATSDIPSTAELNVGLLFAAHKNPAICARPIIFNAARTPYGLSKSSSVVTKQEIYYFNNLLPTKTPTAQLLDGRCSIMHAWNLCG